MHIKHFIFLSWFPASPESHEQDGEKLPSIVVMPRSTASGDPAMAFEPCLVARAILIGSCQPPAAPIAAGSN